MHSAKKFSINPLFFQSFSFDLQKFYFFYGLSRASLGLSLKILLCKFLKSRQRTNNCLICHAVSNPHITWTPKRTSWHKKDIVSLCRLTERFLIFDWRFHKQIESSLRLYTAESTLSQPFIKCFPVSIVLGKICFFSNTFSNHLLKQRRCIDKS